MKIGQPSDTSPAATQGNTPAPAKAGQGTPPAAGADRRSSGVDVTVSAQARRLERTRAGDMPDVDMDKVHAVRQAIAQNTFVVNPGAIADKLLANARDMLNRTRS